MKSKKSKKSKLFSATHAIDVLNESWDTNTIYRFDNGDRGDGVLFVLSNAPADIAEAASQLWYDTMENATGEEEYVSIEACFKKLGYLAVVANSKDKKVY